MILSSISVLLIVACSAALVRIVGRHAHVLSSIDVSAIPEERHAKVKDALIVQRLKRKIGSLGTLLAMLSKPLGAGAFAIQKNIRAFHSTLLSVRADYRKRGVVGGAHVSDENLPVQERVVSLLVKANDALSRKRMKEAEELYIKVIALEKKHMPAYSGLVLVYIEQKEFDHAAEVLHVLCRLQSDASKSASDPAEKMRLERELAESLHSLSDLSLELNIPEEALKAIKKALKIDENNPKYLHALVDIHIRLGQRLKAETALDRLREANPENQRLSEIADRIASLSY